MPIYEYGCECGHETEQRRNMNEVNHPMECSKCGKNMKRQISKTSFALKGSNWERDNYGSGSAD